MDRHARVTADIDSYGSAGRLDRVLRFNAPVADRYERECGAARAASLRHLIVVGLTFYNVYNLTSIFLLPDILGLSVVLRLFVVTPASLCLAWAVGRVGARTREWLVTGGVLNAFAIPVFLFWLTEAPFGGFTFSELTLVIVFGNMLLALRFPQAIVFTLSAFGLATTAVLLKGGLEDGLRAAFVLQMATGCAFCLYANYRMEALRCHGYLKELGATVKSEVAEAARDHFLDLSMTDALTGLPNRRSLDQTTERWSAAGAELAVLMIDVDHFKLFNDALGHPAGDDCLRAIAAALSGATRGTDHFVARFGGEEFTLVARNLDGLGGARLANALVTAVEALGIPHPSRTDGSGVITISVGIALGAGKRETLFRAADAALYAAKRRGRNRYMFADRLNGMPLREISA